MRKAFIDAFHSLRTPGMFWHLIWPTLAAIAFWMLLFVFFWSDLNALALGWIGNFFALSPDGWAHAAAAWLVYITLLMTFIPLAYFTATLLVATIAIPLMLEKVGNTQYQSLSRQHGGSNLGSLWNTIKATLICLLLLIVSLPLWFLIPGSGLIIGVLLIAWLNQKAFAYDALIQHASKDERRLLLRQHREPLFWIGIASALLVYVPFINLLAPAWCGLAFVHYLLQALQQHRQLHGVQVPATT